VKPAGQPIAIPIRRKNHETRIKDRKRRRYRAQSAPLEKGSHYEGNRFVLAIVASVAAMLVAPSGAMAESGGIYSQTAEAYAYFDDSADLLHVCDDRPGNGVGARAQIKVEQEDGSWLAKKPLDSYGGCHSAERPVLREVARVQLWACSLASGGQQYNCQYRVLEGN
jgi:hypothetical protein